MKGCFHFLKNVQKYTICRFYKGRVWRFGRYYIAYKLPFTIEGRVWHPNHPFICLCALMLAMDLIGIWAKEKLTNFFLQYHWATMEKSALGRNGFHISFFSLSKKLNLGEVSAGKLLPNTKFSENKMAHRGKQCSSTLLWQNRFHSCH